MMSESEKKPFKRRFISLEVKMQILDRLLNGETSTQVAKSLNMNEATIRTINKNADLIRHSVAAGSSLATKYSCRSRAPIIEKMEKVLRVWIDDSSRKKIPINPCSIQRKAMKIYQHLKEHGVDSSASSSSSILANPENFMASKGWLEKFKKRFGIHSLEIEGENVWADHRGANTYPEKLGHTIEGYTEHQVFNAGTTGLWWKKLPDRTFISNDEKSASGFKVSTDKIRLILCVNASGDLVTKPLLVYRALNPRALKSADKSALPVYWKAHSKVWVTGFLFRDWFLNCFVPEVKRYLRKKKLDFKVLLLLDNCCCSFLHLKDLLNHPNVKIEFLPPNVASLLQPLDRGVIYTFKIYYVRGLLRWILELTDAESIRVKEAWKRFSIRNCVELVWSSLGELQKSTLNGSWRKLWPSAVELLENVELNTSDDDVIIADIFELAKEIGGAGFEDLASEDVGELLEEEELGEADLIELLTADEMEEAKDDFTVKKLREGLNLAEALEAFFSEADPDAERKKNFKRKLKNCLSPYRQVYDELARSSKKSKVTNDVGLKKQSLLALLSSSSDEDES